MKPTLILFAGPNGAGKSTLQRRVMDQNPMPWVDPDGLAMRHFGSDAAAHALEAFQMAEEERARLLELGDDFGFETVFSDPFGYKIRYLQNAQQAGYRVSVLYIGLASADLAILRVVQRVAAGGHSVPQDKIVSRFHRSLANLATVLPWVDEVMLYDNSSPDLPYRPLALVEAGRLRASVSTLPDWTRPLGLDRLPRTVPLIPFP